MAERSSSPCSVRRPTIRVERAQPHCSTGRSTTDCPGRLSTRSGRLTMRRVGQSTQPWLDISAQLRRDEQRRRGRARVGCSGWSYRDWRGVVYPAELPQRRWFELLHAAVRHRRAEQHLLSTAQPAAVEGWAARRRPTSCYALKLGQFGSHRMKLRDAASWLPNHIDRAERLGASLGPTLVQLPPRWQAQRRAARRVPLRRAAQACAGRSRSASRRGCTTTCSTCSPPRRRAVHPRSDRGPSVRADDRLDVRPLSRTRRDRRAVSRSLRRGPALAPWAERLGEWLDRGSRRVRLLQQRLRRPGRARRAVAAPRNRSHVPVGVIELVGDDFRRCMNREPSVNCSACFSKSVASSRSTSHDARMRC